MLVEIGFFLFFILLSAYFRIRLYFALKTSLMKKTMFENQPITPNMIIVNIYWDKYEFEEEQIKKLNTASDYGLYQIYGRHSAYGKDALLYIGQSNSQTFSQRLNKRWEFIESCAYPHTMRIGRIVKSNNPSDEFDWHEDRWTEMINHCEKLLLHTHAPAFNKQGNSGLYNIDIPNNNIHIFNWGDFGDLLPEVSSYRYSFKYWNYETPLT